MVSSDAPQYHLHCHPGDVGTYALLLADPGQVPAIAEQLEQPRFVARHREYVTYSGTVAGKVVSVTSTGLGGPSTAIAVEELAVLGTRTIVWLGTAEAVQPFIRGGDLVLAWGAARVGPSTAPARAGIAWPNWSVA
jgi:uridine phosphorylase